MRPAAAPAVRAAARRALSLADAALLAECREEFFVASGPGGQRRNKAATGVRLAHRASGVAATTSRNAVVTAASSHMNRRRLRTEPGSSSSATTTPL